MKRITARLAVLAAGIAVPAAIATGAMAATDPGGGQTAAQLNKTQQQAQAEAQSNQWAPSSNTAVAEGSKDSNNGNVTQAPQSQADAAAINDNQTKQDIQQQKQQEEQQKQQDPSQDPSQAQDPGKDGQTALQANKTDQNANCQAESNQWAPSQNEQVAKDSQNVNNGNVKQAPSSEAQCVAANTNTTDQNIDQQKEEQQKQDQNNG